MVAYFQLQPAEAELQELAEDYWKKAGEKVQELEKAAFEAGEAIRSGDFTLANLESIVRWKSERSVQYLIANSNEKIRRVLAAVTAPGANTESAVKALLDLQGVDLPVASAILAAIYPERYTVLDYRAARSPWPCPARRALLRGIPLAYCESGWPRSNIVQPQSPEVARRNAVADSSRSRAMGDELAQPHQLHAHAGSTSLRVSATLGGYCSPSTGLGSPLGLLPHGEAPLPAPHTPVPLTLTL